MWPPNQPTTNCRRGGAIRPVGSVSPRLPRFQLGSCEGLSRDMGQLRGWGAERSQPRRASIIELPGKPPASLPTASQGQGEGSQGHRWGLLGHLLSAVNDVHAIQADGHGHGLPATTLQEAMCRLVHLAVEEGAPMSGWGGLGEVALCQAAQDEGLGAPFSCPNPPHTPRAHLSPGKACLEPHPPRRPRALGTVLRAAHGATSLSWLRSGCGLS